MAPRLRIRSYAKINLALEVLGRRDDGFHEIVSVTQTISLHDVVECGPSTALAVCAEPPIVEPDENLVTRAALLLAADTGRSPKAELLIRKRIPIAAGLGGGSSNAAAALRLLDRLWRTRLPEPRLMHLAARLGSDVPLFLVGGAAIVEGRGERVRPIAVAPRLWFAVAVPHSTMADKTRALYGALSPNDWSDGARTRMLADRLHECIDGVVAGRSMLNAFDRAAAALYPDFTGLRARLSEAAGVSLHLTGAGPALFAVFPTRLAAAAAAQRMGALGVRCHVARSIAGRPKIGEAGAAPLVGRQLGLKSADDRTSANGCGRSSARSRL